MTTYMSTVHIFRTTVASTLEVPRRSPSKLSSIYHYQFQSGFRPFGIHISLVDQSIVLAHCINLYYDNPSLFQDVLELSEHK